VGSRILAYRPAVVVDRLAPRSDACLLSLRDLLSAAQEVRAPLPIVRAPLGGVARAALVAASEAQAAIGLSLPPGSPVEPWFEAVTRAADEFAGGLPIFLSAEVAVDGGTPEDVERGEHDAFRLVDAGITHLAIDVRAVPAEDRATAFAAVAAPAAERGCCVDALVDVEVSPRALFEALERVGAAPEVASVRCPGVTTTAEAKAQLVRLVRICADIQGIPVIRRGPVSPPLLEELARSPVRGCEDGGAAAMAGITVIPWEALERSDEDASRKLVLDRAAEELSIDAADRLEARAYVEAASFIERLGAAGSARRLAAALERRLDER
jgi:hypothetical protein